MKIHRIDQMHLVPLLRERESIHAGGAPDVVNHSRCGGKKPSKNRLRPKTLQFTQPPPPAPGPPPLQIKALQFFLDPAHSTAPPAPPVSPVETGPRYTPAR